MKKIKRNLLNVLPTLIIIIGTILVILFSKGWRIDIKEKTVVNTGILDISSNPKGATLLLDDKVKGLTPVVVDSLPPRKYKVELRKENYSSWQKEVEIAEGTVLKIETNLFEENTKVIQTSDIPLEKIYFSQNGSEALIVSLRNGQQGIWKTQLDPIRLLFKKTPTKVANLYEPKLYDLLTSFYNFNISPNFSKAILCVKQENGSNSNRCFLLDLESSESNITEISEYITDINFAWSQDDKYLFGNNQSFFSFNIETFQKSILSERNYKNLWTISNDKIFYAYHDPINDSYKIISANFNGTKREQLNLDKFQIENLSLIQANTEYNFLLIADDKATYIFDLNSKEITKIFDHKIIIVNTSLNQRYLILKQEDENNYYTFDFEYSSLSDSFNLPVENPIWTPDSLKIFYRFTNQDNKNILGSMDPDGTNSHELLALENYTGQLNTEFGFSSDSRKVYIPLLSSYNYINKQDSEDFEKFEEIVLFEIELR